jgi:hypothetical protein
MRWFTFLPGAGALAITALVVSFGIWLATPRGPLLRERYDKVQRGMTMREVQNLLGRPLALSGDKANAAAAPGVLAFTEAMWQGRDGKLVIMFLSDMVWAWQWTEPGGGKTYRGPC